MEKCNTKLVRCFTTNSFKSPFKNKLSVNKWNITFFNSQKTDIKGNLTYIYPLASTQNLIIGISTDDLTDDKCTSLSGLGSSTHP